LVDCADLHINHIDLRDDGQVIRAVQLLLGRSKMKIAVRYLGIEVDHAIEFAEKIDT